MPEAVVSRCYVSSVYAPTLHESAYIAGASPLMFLILISEVSDILLGSNDQSKRFLRMYSPIQMIVDGDPDYFVAIVFLYSRYIP